MLARQKQESAPAKKLSTLIVIAGIITAMLISLFVARLFAAK
jgi:hypothetical protein